MTPEKIKFEILTPHQKVFSSDVTAVRLPGYSGYFGVLPRHTPYLSSLRLGEIKVQINQDISYFATSGGFVEVFPHSITVLAETAEPARAIDHKRAEAARDRALNRQKEGQKAWSVPRAQAALLRAINRIRVASKS